MNRVLSPTPVTTLDAFRSAGGGEGLSTAIRLDPAAITECIGASGLRGRGGAGFPTGVKWKAVTDYESPVEPATVVVNAAEGEPGSFKDRAILRANPYAVLEGALVAARAVGADRVVVALKGTFGPEITAVERAIAEMAAVGWSDGITVDVARGPSEYLFGEETGLLEVLDGRAPFPRVTPPYRRGIDEVGDGAAGSAVSTLATTIGTAAAPTLVDNVETLANVGAIVARGPEWFRELGTPKSPGTIVCTVSGDTNRHGVAEVPMGTTLRDLLDEVSGGLGRGRHVKAVLSGVANPFLPGSLLDTALTYEAMAAAGSGLGAAGFIVLDDRRDIVSVARGVSRFLGVESCGQCRACKQDGLAMSELLLDLCRSEAGSDVLAQLADRVSTVADGARCSLASQQERVVGSLLALFPDEVRARATGTLPAVEPMLIAPIIDIVDDRVVLDERHAAKQPDWTYNDTDSGQAPADRIDQEAHMA